MNEMTRMLLVFLGAGTGGVLRYGVDRVVYAAVGRAFPWGTMLINVTGSLAIGVLYQWMTRQPIDRVEPWRLLLITGVLGGYTTFSAFSRETMTLLDERQVGWAGAYVVLSVVLSVGATVLGARVVDRVLA